MNTFSDVIEALTIAGTADILDITESHARTLKARDSIPPVYFRRIVQSEAGLGKGITFEVLFRILESTMERKPKVAAQQAVA